jgi:hypothetical protein
MIPLSRDRYLLSRKIYLLGLLVALATTAAPVWAENADSGSSPEADQAFIRNIAPNGAGDAPVGITSEIVTISDAPAQLRGSLSMRAAPMSQIFTLLGAMTPLRFRYASPPDAVLTAEWKDALLLPALEKTLQAARWQVQREGVNVFVFPTKHATDSSGAPQGWQYWNDASPPPRRWMAMDALRPPKVVQTKLASSPTGTGRAGTAKAGTPTEPPKSVVRQNTGNSGSNRIVVRWRTEPTAATSEAWSDVILDIDATQRPGVRVFAPGDTSRSSAKLQVTGTAETLDGSAWLRWRLPLRFVPRGARLLLETPVAATLYVNGAPLLSRRSGINTIDLSRVLIAGENYLALRLADVPPELRGIKNGLAVAATAREQRPLFRYEWIFDGAFNGSQTERAAD